jgi:long-chain acyl-CoA synthetase
MQSLTQSLRVQGVGGGVTLVWDARGGSVAAILTMSGRYRMLSPYPTVVHMLDAAARAAPDAVALRCGDEALTYRDYAACVAAFAEKLTAHQVAGSRVALVMGNSIDICIATFAAQAAGAQIVPLNPAYTSPELQPLLADAAPAAIVCDEVLSAVVAPIAATLDLAPPVIVGPGSRLTRWAGGEARVLPLPDPASLATLQYTGGTTGRAKGVDLTHAAVAANIAQREALLPTEPGEHVLVVTPLYHSYAVAMGLYLAVWCRGSLTIVPRYRPETVLAAIAEHRISFFSGSPTLFIGLMAHEAFARTDFSSLRLCSSGSAALPLDVLQRWEAATGCPICEGYGQSEAGPVLTYNPRHGRRKPGSVGIALPDTLVEIVDSDQGIESLPPGAVGEIRARGPQIMTGYRHRPAETAAALRGGYLYTGDIGMIDDDGYLHILDRKKDMVIVGGFNVYPREVEEVLCTHPAVAEAAVVGVPDDYRGEALRAFLVPRAGAGEERAAIDAFLAERLTRYKRPRDIMWRRELPKTAVGKIDKVALRKVTG